MTAKWDTGSSSDSSNIRLLQGQQLTLTVEAPSGSSPSVQWKGPGSKSKGSGQRLSLPGLDVQESGTWTCTISQNQKTVVFNINILVLGKRGASPLQSPLCLSGRHTRPLLPLLCSWVHCWSTEGGSSPLRSRSRSRTVL